MSFRYDKICDACNLVQFSGFDCRYEDNVPAHLEEDVRSLNEYLCKKALVSLEKGVGVTMLLYDDDTFIGYFTIVTSQIRELDKSDKKEFEDFDFEVYPAIRIVKLAVHRKYHKKGGGTDMLEQILAISCRISDTVGLRFITTDALAYKKTLQVVP